MDYSNLLAGNLIAKNNTFETEDDYYAMYGRSDKFDKLRSVFLRCGVGVSAIGKTIASARDKSGKIHVEV